VFCSLIIPIGFNTATLLPFAPVLARIGLETCPSCLRDSSHPLSPDMDALGVTTGEAAMAGLAGTTKTKSWRAVFTDTTFTNEAG
jgi:hypothetical protein